MASLMFLTMPAASLPKAAPDIPTRYSWALPSALGPKSRTSVTSVASFTLSTMRCRARLSAGVSLPSLRLTAIAELVAVSLRWKDCSSWKAVLVGLFLGKKSWVLSFVTLLMFGNVDVKIGTKAIQNIMISQRNLTENLAIDLNIATQMIAIMSRQ